MKKIPESRSDIQEILLEQVDLLAKWNEEFGYSKPEQMSINIETILSVFRTIC